MQSTSRYLASSDGAQIYADAVGDPSKPCIVFIHGLALSAVVFDNIFNDKKYNSKFYLVRYDMRGHGRSSKPNTMERYSSKLYADDFTVVMNAFNLHKPVVVGWSLGSLVVADIAAYLPRNTLAGAVYLSGGPHSGSVFNVIGTPFLKNLLVHLVSSSGDITDINRALETFADCLFNDPNAIPWNTRSLWRGMITFQKPDHRRFALTRQQDPTKLFELGAHGLPVLVLAGTLDPQLVGGALVEMMEQRFANLETHLIEGGGHTLHLENTEETMGLISAFVQKKCV